MVRPVITVVQTDIGVNTACTIVDRIVLDVQKQMAYAVDVLVDNMDLIVTPRVCLTVQHVDEVTIAQHVRMGFYRGRYHDISGTETFYDCRLPCNVNCTKCSSYGSCEVCKDGTYGRSCSSQCSEGCTNDGCNKNNGYCECKEGYKGSGCDNCKSGFSGDTCVEEIEPNPSCAKCSCCIDGICNADDKTCDHGCTDGHWGDHCMYDCVPNCSKCSKTTGVCSTCISGRFGSNCNNTCLTNCATCSGGTSCLTCKDGFYRGRYKDIDGTQTFYDCRYKCLINCTKCSSFGRCTECQTGKYGTTCSSVCSQGCENNVCTQLNGYCDCTEGFEGLICDNCLSKISGDTCVSAQTAGKGNNNTATYVLLGLTCIVIGLLIAFAFLMFIRYQRKRNVRRSSETRGNTEAEMPDIAAITASNGQPNSDNANPSRATYYNCSQVADGDTFQENTALSEHYYTSLQSGSAANNYTVPCDQKAESDYENVKTSLQ